MVCGCLRGGRAGSQQLTCRSVVTEGGKAWGINLLQQMAADSSRETDTSGRHTCLLKLQLQTLRSLRWKSDEISFIFVSHLSELTASMPWKESVKRESGYFHLYLTVRLICDYNLLLCFQVDLFQTAKIHKVILKIQSKKSAHGY